MPESKKKGFITKHLTRNEDGDVTTVYVDLDTGKRVSNPRDYEVIDQYTAQLIQLGLAPDPREEEKKKEDTQNEEEKSEELLRRGGRDTVFHEGNARSVRRDESDNYGYVNKPGALGFAKSIPGMVGLAARGIDAGININNKVAIDSARRSLGLPEQKGFRDVAGYFKDNKGYVGDISYNGVTSPVGLEATDKLGRTTLTPREARLRQQSSAVTGEATEAEKAASIENFKQENPRAGKSFGRRFAETAVKGAISGAMQGDIVGGIIGSLVGSVKSAGVNLVKDKAMEVVDDVLSGETPQNAQANEIEQEAENKGLGSLSPSFNEGIRYDKEDTRGPVSTGLTERTMDVLDSLAANTSGGINVTSAFRDRATNRRVGGAANSLHSQGAAFDLSTKGLNDQQKRDLVERSIMAGGMEMGTYPDQSLHVGTVQRTPALDPELTGGVAAMYDRTRHQYNNAPDWFKDGIEVSRLAATPTPRPEYNPLDQPQGLVNEAVANVDLSRMGMFDNVAKASMARTLAGEIDPRYTDLNTPEGQREAFGILSTIENRAARYGSVVDAIHAPNQYSTWNNEQVANNAIANYNANPDLFDNLVEQYTSNPNSNLGFSSYYNPSVANPGWGPKMVQTEEIGPHRFGSLPEYGSFGQNFGQQLSEETQKATKSTPSGLGTFASAEGTIGMGQGLSQGSSTSNMGGFSSSVSGENANRQTESSGRDTTGQSGGFGDRDSVGATRQNDGWGDRSTTSTTGSSFSSYDRSKDDGLGGTSSIGSTYDRSKDDGFGGTGSVGTTSSDPHNKGDSETSSGRLGGRV